MSGRKIASFVGLREMPSYAWLIKCGNKAFIYSGSPSGLNAAKDRVQEQSRGSTVRIQKLVS